MARHTHSTDINILNRIYGKGRGWVFTPTHLKDLGSRDAVASALKRHKKAGTIRQLARGLYDYPVQHRVLGIVAPSADAIARALVGRDAIRLQPAGAYAANLLGLSEQVPSKVVFLTDGPNRKVRVGTQEIILQRTTPRNMATAGRKSGTLIQALRHLGKDQVDDKVIAILRREINDCRSIGYSQGSSLRPGVDCRHSPGADRSRILNLWTPFCNFRRKSAGWPASRWRRGCACRRSAWKRIIGFAGP